MTITPAQLSAVATVLAVDLSTVTDDRLIELCLLHRCAPAALPSFLVSLETELVRRFTPQYLAANDVIFAVLQNFANNFASPIPYFQLQMLQMAATVNRDIWFSNNAGLFTDAMTNADLTAWLVTQPDILTKVLHNQIALSIVAASTIAATAILTTANAVAIFKDTPNIWAVWTQHSAGMTVIAQSSELMTYVINNNLAMSAVIASSTAMSAVAASSTAMSAVIASSTAMSAVAASSTAMSAVAASSTAMSAVAASSAALSKIVVSTSARNALMSNNTVLQSNRDAILNTIKSNWLLKRRQAYNQTNNTTATTDFNTSAGFVFAYIGRLSAQGTGTGTMTMKHPNGSNAASGSIRDMSNDVFTLVSPIDAISLNGMSLTFTGLNPRASIELWSPT